MEKVSPVLAEIIGYIDTNNNLDILFEGSEWKKDLWLKCFKTEDAVNLKVRTNTTFREYREVSPLGWLIGLRYNCFCYY